MSKYTDADGRTALSAGLGDMLVWASKDGAYGYVKVHFGEDTEATVTLDSPVGVSELLAIVPPVEDVVLPRVTPEQRAENDRRMAYEDSVRKAYMAGFPDREAAAAFVAEQGLPPQAARLVEASAGNGATIMGFLRQAPDKERAVRLLSSLSQKDLSDVPADILWDSYNATESILSPRIESEFLSPYKGWFLQNVPADLQEAFRGGGDPGQGARAILGWIRDNVTVDEDPLFWDIPQYNAAKPGEAAPAAGPFGPRGDWRTIDLASATDVADAPTGHVKLLYEPVEGIERPQYGQHFSLSRIVDGRPQAVGFGMGGRRGGGGNEADLPEGDYLLASGNRLSDGSTPVTVNLFHVTPGETLEVPLKIETMPEEVKVLGNFTPRGVLSSVEAGYYVVAVLDVGLEPTNHLLNDLSAARTALEAWGCPIYLIATSEAQLERLHNEIDGGRFGTLPATVVFGIDQDGSILSGLAEGLDLRMDQLPLVGVVNTDGRAVYASQGYTIGTGEKIAALARKL